ncbi:xanthine dehydrogenase family protein molybdopterin-binding subunit [Chloroflexota bacterium]
MYKDMSIAGKSIPLREGHPKATGLERFASDRDLAGALHMKTLYSPHAHAKIKNIDVSKAEALPGVGAVLTYRDVPPNDIVCGILNWKGKVLEDRVRFVGDEVAAIAAESVKVAENALDLIQVEYEQLPAVFDIEEAMKQGAPDVRGIGTNMVATPPDIGMFQSLNEWGDLEKGFAAADTTIECEVRTQSIYGGFFPPACIAEWDGDKLILMISHQCPFEIRTALCNALDIPEQKVRIIAPLLAGTFGMLNSAHRFWHIASLLSKKSDKPVVYKMTLEEFGVYKRRELDILRIKLGGKKDGEITALDFEQLHDNGGYGYKSTTYGAMHDILPRANVRFIDRGVNINKFSSGCIRGVGDVVRAQALNQAVDMLAEQLGVDPLTIWKKNHQRAGEPLRSRNRPGLVLSSEAYDELMDKGAEAIEWGRKWQGWGKSYRVSGARKRGVGMALAVHGSGIPALPAASTIRINHDGTAQISIGFMDLGTGCKTTFAQICAEVMGLKIDDVYVVKDVDTDTVPYVPMTGASISMHIGGSAVKVAAKDAKKQILEMACTAPWSPGILKEGVNGADDLDIENSFVYVKADRNRKAPVKDILNSPFAAIVIGRAPRHDIPTTGQTALITMVVFADVEVDTETGKVNVLKLIDGQDSGRIINPEICENQVYGGVLQSFGYALTEEVVFDPATGKALNPALSDYWVATSMDAPSLQVIFSSNIDPVGPLGAKGIGEAPAICAHAAISGAIYNATGVRVSQLPITPDKVLEALGRK